MEYKSGVQNPKSVHKVSTPGRTDVRYWSDRVFKLRASAGSFSVKIQHAGARQLFTLYTANRIVAATKARDIYVFLVANGWVATIAKYKATSEALPTKALTVGEFFAELESKSDLKAKTLAGYTTAFRKIVGDIFGYSHGRGGGKTKRTSWRERVHATPLAAVTPAKVQKWKIDFVAKAGTDPVKQRSAHISANTFIRRSKALFAPGQLKFLPDLSSPLPFDGVEFYKRQSMRYRSSFDLAALVRQARDELAVAHPEEFKVFLLATASGLRRREIDTLEWPAFLWELGLIRIEATKWFHPKSEDSLGDVPVEPEIIAIFRGYHAKATTSFVIESDVAPRLDVARWEHYRCASIFERLIAWLRGKGVDTKTPLHTLRKEFGSRVTAEHGIYSASRLLRHSDIATTARHYVVEKRRVTAGLGPLFSDNLVEIDAEGKGAV